MNSLQLVQDYYAAFNRQDRQKLLSCLSEDVCHDINQGHREVGLAAFNKFLDRMDASYRENLSDIRIMMDSTGGHASAEFIVTGTYLKTDVGLPEARGQKYVIPAGTFFEIDTTKWKINRVTTYYNLPAWIEAVK